MSLSGIFGATGVLGNPPFPTFNNGVVSAIEGYAEEDLLYSTVEALDSGYANSYSWNSYYDGAGAFHNFQEERFSINFPMLTQAEVVTLENFFAYMNGPWGYFQFTDDQNVVWPQCQFDQDTLEFQYLGPNQYSVECKILAVTQAVIPSRPLPNPPPPPPIVKTVESGLITVWSSYTNSSGIPKTAGIAALKTGDAGFGQFDLHAIVKTMMPYSLRADTYQMTSDDIAAMNRDRDWTISCFLSNAGSSDLSDTGSTISLQIYDVYMDVGYTDASTARVKPTQFVLTNGNNVPGFGILTNGANAFDADTSPPATFAQLVRSAWDFFDFVNVFQIFGFPV